MKVQLDGDPAEIVSFFEQLHFRTQNTPETSGFAYTAPEPSGDGVAALADINATLETPIAREKSAEVAEELVPPAEVSNHRPAIKDRITQWLQTRGVAAPAREIARAIGLRSNAVSARLVELAREGYVRKFSEDGQAQHFEFVRAWEPKQKGGRKQAVAVAPVAAAPEQTVAPQPASAPGKTKHRRQSHIPGTPTQKERIIGFLGEYGRATTLEIREYLNIPMSNIKARLAELVGTNIVRRFDPEQGSRNPSYELFAAPVAKAVPAVVAPAPETVSGAQAEYLRIFGALVENKGPASPRDLARLTNMSRLDVTQRLNELQTRGLVERKGRTSALVFAPVVPNRKTQAPPPMNSLNEAVLECVRQFPGSSSKEIAIRLMKAWSEVARRLHDLEKTTVVCRQTADGDRYYLR